MSGADVGPAELEVPPRPPQGCPFGMDPSFAEWREQEPVKQVRMRDGTLTWLVTRHEDMREILKAPGVRANPDTPGFPSAQMGGRRSKTVDNTLLRLDAPDHSRVRRIVAKEFIPKRATALREILADKAKRLCRDMATLGPGADFVSQVARPLTSEMINELLGVPHAKVDEIVDMIRISTDVSLPDDVVEDSIAGSDEYFRGLIEEKRQSPGNDTLSRLIHTHDEGDRLTSDELLSLAWLLIVAGYDTTANSIALSTYLLCEQPELMDQLRENPSLFPNAVEEFLRYTSVVRSGPRRALVEDQTVHGTAMRAGEGVVALVAVGNRDPEVFPDPDEVDLGRPNAGDHLAFGFGPHQCLGQHLAREEMLAVLPRVIEDFRGLRLAIPREEIEFKVGFTIYGVSELPVAWDEYVG